MGNLLEEILLLKKYKETYSTAEFSKIKKELAARCNKKIKSTAKDFLQAIEQINKL